MNLDQQKELIKLINKFENIPIYQLKNNIKYYIDNSGYKSKYIAESLKIDIETVYSWKQPNKNTWKVNFIYALKLCDFLRITIDQLIEINEIKEE